MKLRLQWLKMRSTTKYMNYRFYVGQLVKYPDKGNLSHDIMIITEIEKCNNTCKARILSDDDNVFNKLNGGKGMGLGLWQIRPLTPDEVKAFREGRSNEDFD